MIYPDKATFFVFSFVLASSPSRCMRPHMSTQGRPLCEVLVHGSGECDQLGLGEGVLERRKPTIIKSLSDEQIVSVAVGSLHNLALCADGRVFSWGCNDDGAIGRLGDENVPMSIPLFEKIPIRKVSVGDCHSAFLDYADRLWLCGTYKDSSGHLGFPDYSKGIGHVHHKQVEPVLVQGLPARSRVEDVVCGANHTVITVSSNDSRRRSSIASEGLRVLAWGNDEFGQLGLGFSRDEEQGRPEEDTVMLRHTSRGKRHLKTKLFPRDVLWNFKTAGKVNCIFATAQTTFVKTTNSSIFGCGLNNFGQLGVGNTSPYPIRILTKVDFLSSFSSPVVCITGGSVHTAALLEDGRVVSWGRRDYCGIPVGMGGDVQPPAIIPDLSRVAQISCGGSHTLASTRDGKVYAWGFGGTHQLGNLPRDISMGAAAADEEPQDEQQPYLIQSKQLADRFVLAVAAGAQHSVELTFNGTYSESSVESLSERACSLTPLKRRSISGVISSKKRRTDSG